MARDEVRRHYRGDNYVLTSDYDDADVLAKVQNVDGSGSGLDADTVDGSHATAFAASTHASQHTWGGADPVRPTVRIESTIGGNGEIGVGTDVLIPVTATANRTGITVEAGAFDGQFIWIVNHSSNRTLTFDVTDSTSRVAGGGVLQPLTIYQYTWDANFAGSGVGRWVKEAGGGGAMTGAEILAALAPVDGSGSGLDADTVDGVEASALVQTTRTISTTAPLTGGGDLSANRTLAVSAASDTAAGVVELSTDAELATGTDTTRATTPANIASRGFERTANKDANSGYIGRGSSGQASVPYLDLPEQSGATPSSDTGRIYGLDVGGKTDLEYRDSVGVVARPFRDSYFVAQNTTGSTIAKGSAVRVSGQSASGIPLIALADADASGTMPAAGITMESITTTSYGRVMIQGILTGLATTGLTAGTPVYASGTAGGITGTAPVYPAFRQVLGSVMSVNASTGEIFVNVAHFFRQVGVPILLTFFYGSTLSATTGVGRSPITTNTAGTVTEVRLTVNSAPSAGAITVGIRKNGAAAFTSPTIAQSAFAGSVTGLSTAVAAGDYLTADISGTLTGASDLVVTVEVMTAS